MLPDRFLKQQELICKNMQRAMQPTLEIQSIAQRMRAPMAVAERLQEQANISSALSSRLEGIINSHQTCMLRTIQLPYDNLARAVQSYNQLVSSISTSEKIANLLANSVTDSILNSVAVAIASAQSYISVEQYEEYTETIEPALSQKNGHRLTLGVWLSLIGLLFDILFGIVSILPNEQLDRIIQQNDIIIDQQQEMLELKKEDAELRDTLNALIDSINLLSDEIDSLRDEIEGSDDVSESDSQTDTENGQQ